MCKWFKKKTVKVDPLPKVNPTKPEEPKRKKPSWFVFAKKYEGKKEIDPAFNKEMSVKWKLFGMNLGTIAQSWAAWCGLAVAVSLSGVGLDYQRNGALARNWAQYGEVIEWRTNGIPQGAIVHINHKFNCNSGESNHVAFAEGDCTPEDLKKSGGTITLYGGNQGNTWKQSDYPVAEVCNVRWPKNVAEYPKPGKITKSINCSKNSANKESTR